MAARADEGGFQSLRVLGSTDSLSWLAPSQHLSRTARTASQHLFSCLNPFCPKSPFDGLLVEGFDAEQVWQQIDLQSKPLIASLQRELKRIENNPKEISDFCEQSRKSRLVTENLEGEHLATGGEAEGAESDEPKQEDMDAFDDHVDDEGDNDDDDNDDDKYEEDGGEGIEDQFLKIKDLEKYLEEGEAREYGLEVNKRVKKSNKNNHMVVGDEEEEEIQDGDGSDNDDEFGIFSVNGEDANGAPDELDNARYEDFFGTKKKKDSKRKLEPFEGSGGLGTDEDSSDIKKNGHASTHERELLKFQANVEQMHKAALEPKSWLMQGEVMAAKRPENSALEVDLDFDHNVRPPPVITEEVTASLEDLIRGRIIEGRFDDVQKASSSRSNAFKELKELDDNKSKKGLAEVYEEEYVESTGLGPTPSSFSDEQKNEAQMVFKKLCMKLDSLSHFHFAPKPVIEDMSVQANVPALAMEEIAPVMVSDAAMLAPEEVFAGKGAVKEETELTKEERRRRRASKKRKFKSK